MIENSYRKNFTFISKITMVEQYFDLLNNQPNFQLKTPETIMGKLQPLDYTGSM